MDQNKGPSPVSYPLTILVDVDEVLADFVGGALAVHGRTREELPDGMWDITGPMELTQEQFWDPINREGAQFWIRLHETPWARELIVLLEKIAPRQWYLVTSPPQLPEAYYGKAAWIKRQFGPRFDRIVITSHKHLLARPDTVLIDDREETIGRFIKAGGNGLLFPSPRNRLYSLAANAVSYVRGRLESFTTTLKERTHGVQVQEHQRCLPPTRYGLS